MVSGVRADMPRGGVHLLFGLHLAHAAVPFLAKSSLSSLISLDICCTIFK
jgi:hypothetical protein